MSVTIRPAVESDQATIRAIVRAARINPRNLHWPRFMVAEDQVRALLARETGPLYMLVDVKYAQHYDQFGFRPVQPSELPTSLAKEYRLSRIITSIASLVLRRKIHIVPLKRDS